MTDHPGTAPETAASDTLMDNRKRELAYQLWEEAGRPEGLADHFWFMACELETLVEELRNDPNLPNWLQRSDSAQSEDVSTESVDLTIEELRRRIDSRAAA